MAKGKHSYAKQRRAEQAELDRRKKESVWGKIKALPKRYFIDAMGAMALGLFASLLIGTIIVAIVYVVYYIGLAGAVDSATMMAGGEAGAKIAFTNVFGKFGGVAIFAFVVISCWGTLNGLTMAVTRGLYDLAEESGSSKLAMFKNVDPNTGMPTNSAVFGLFISALWLVYFYGGCLMGNWFGPFCFDSSELPIITLYAMYIPIFIMWMVKEKDLGFFKRFLLPILAILACAFMVFAAVYAHGITPYLNAKANGEFSFPVLFYLILFAIIMIAGAVVRKSKKKADAAE